MNLSVGGSPALAQPAPFADHDQVIVVVSQGFRRSKSNAAIVNLTTGRSVQLGPADAAAGDPQSLGAFVSVPVSSDAGYLAGSADSSIELREAQGPPTTLATAGELNQDVGQLPSTPVDLAVYPDATGIQLAVLLNPLGATTSNVPMVILDRHGHVLSTVVEAAGPIANAQPAWSPNGRLLAYPSSASTGPALAIQTTDGQPQIYQASNPSTQFGSCIWSPTDITVVCQARIGSRTEWDFANTATGTLRSTNSPGYPIVWLPPGALTERSR